MKRIVIVAVLFVVALLLNPQVYAQAATETLASDFWLTSLGAEQANGIETTAEGTTLVGHESTLLTAPFTAGWEFIALGVTWQGGLPDDLKATIEARVSPDGLQWGNWQTLSLMQADGPDGTIEVGTDLLFDAGRFAQVRIATHRADTSPFLWRDLKLTVIDGRPGPEITPPLVPDAPQEGPPAVVSRAGWGANENYRFDSNGNELWPREYWTLRGFFVHHTASAPTSPPSASVRSIYYYHAVTLGWGDIGYHYIVDQNGTIYQGRYGTESNGYVVEGGHTLGYNRHTMGVSMIGNFASSLPPTAQLNAAKEILAWRSYQYGLTDPYASMYLDGVGDISPDRWFSDTILGHRDSHTPARTTCPGDAGYTKMPEIRAYVAARIAQISGPTVQIAQPAANAVLNGTVTLQANASPSIVRVEYELDGSVIAVSRSAPWAVSVDSRSLAAGGHALRAVGYTSSGTSVQDERGVEVALNSGSPATTPTAEPTRTPTPTLVPTATFTPSPTATPAPTFTPSATPEGTPTVYPDSTLYLPLVGYERPPDPPPAPLPPRCVGMLDNSDFHANDGWVMLLGDVAARYASEQKWDGERSLRAGMEPGAPYTTTASWSSARRPITLPNDNRTATLTVRFLRESDNVAAGGDRQYLAILNDAGVYTASVIPSGMTNESIWQSTTYDLAAFKGQTIYLYMGVQNNGDAYGTRMYLDDIQVTLCGE